MTNDPNDFELWHQMQSGDIDAFSQIYYRHLRPLYEYGIRRYEDKAIVKDIIHDLFVKIWTKRQTLNPNTSVKSYLFTALRNSFHEQHRLSEIRGRILQNFQHNEEPTFRLDFEYIQKEESLFDRKKLEAALNQLSSRQKEVIYLRYFEDVPYDEIGKIMGIQTKAVYKLSARAMENLKDILKTTDGGLLFMLISLKLLV